MEKLNVVFQSGELVKDENNNILFCNEKGNYVYVPRSMLDENFFEQVRIEQEQEQAEPLQLNEQAYQRVNEVEQEQEQAEALPLSEQAYQRVNEVEQEQEQAEPLSLSDARAHWTRSQILQLIAAYKENKYIFESNTIKNTIAWRNISQAIQTHSIKQCEAKFKYLKTLYIKKKDNMGSGSSGARAISFDYFEEMEEIFRAEPNVQPVSLASSAVVQPTSSALVAAPVAEANTVGSPQQSRPVRRRRRTRLEIQFETFQRSIIEREAARERRMDRFIRSQEITTNKICDLLQKFIDKM